MTNKKHLPDPKFFGRVWYKFVQRGGKAPYVSNFRYPKEMLAHGRTPGKPSPYIKTLKVCRSGWHLWKEIPWCGKDRVLYVAKPHGRGKTHRDHRDKATFHRITLLRQIPAREWKKACGWRPY
jgi:hypothetical protein